MQVLHYFGSSTRWNAQVNNQNELFYCIIVAPPLVVSSYGVLSPLIWHSLKCNVSIAAQMHTFTYNICM